MARARTDLLRVPLGALALSCVEVQIVDPAHDDDHEGWWPFLDGAHLVFFRTHANDVARLLDDAADSEDESGSKRTAWAARLLADRIRKMALKD